MSNARQLRLRPPLVAPLATALLAAAVLAPYAAGNLTITSPLVADFAGITLNGAAQTRTAALDTFSVSDDAVVGAGWNVTVQATQFKEYAAGAYVIGGKTLPPSSLTMPAPTVTPNGIASPAPTTQAGAPWVIDNGAVKIASAAADEGMGQYDFGAVTVSVRIPASAHAKTYRSDVTFSAVAGP